MMKVCFVMSGVPHYVTLLLNKLCTEHGTEITLIKPAMRSQSVGSGVHEDASKRQFRLVELEEYRTWYGKPFLRKMQETLHENPNYGVASVQYAPTVADILKQTGAPELLDYGAGKGRLGETLKKLMPAPPVIRHYDPARRRSAIPAWLR